MTLIQFARKLRRFVRRTRLQLAAASGPQLGELEEQIVFHLYSRAAQALGLEARRLGRVLCISGGGRVFRVHGTLGTDFDGLAAAALAGDKVTVRELLEGHGLPIPAGQSFSSEEPGRAVEFALSLGRPCVVKPASDTAGGVGVSVNLRTRRQIRRAFEFASVYCRRILIEEMVPGDSFRFLVYKGHCLSVVRRETAQVAGSGTETVRRLIECENQRRFKGGEWKEGDSPLMPIRLNHEVRVVLREQGLGWSSVPEKGRIVRLASLANIRSGGTFLEVTQEANAKAVRAAEAAARIIGLELTGVDILSSDIKSEEFCLTEVNTSPYVPMHYCIRNPEQGRDPIRVFLADFFRVPDEASPDAKPAGES